VLFKLAGDETTKFLQMKLYYSIKYKRNITVQTQHFIVVK